MYFKNFNKVNIDINGDGITDTLVNLTNNIKISDALINNTGYYNTVTVIEGERPDTLSQRLYGTPWYHWTFFLLNSNIKNIWNDWPMSTAQLREYSGKKYKNLAILTDDTLVNKFTVGENVKGLLSQAIGTVKEIHVNDHYIIIELVSTTAFSLTGESVLGLNSSDSVIATSISSAMNAPKYHVDLSSGEPTAKREAGTKPFSFYEWEVQENDKNRNIKAIRPTHIEAVVTEFKKEISK